MILKITYSSTPTLPFKDFDTSAAETKGRHQLAQYVEFEIDAYNEWSEPDSESEQLDSEYSDLGAPGK